jgi:hypothetical protein
MTIAHDRLAAQCLAGSEFEHPAELVSWLVAVQAQDRAAAKWALGIRLRGHTASVATVDAALAAGSVLRTHVMRWTWQLVSPADVRWLLALVGPRLLTAAAARHRELGLSAATFRRARTAFERALDAGVHLTRPEMAGALSRARLPCTGPALSHLLAVAELEGVICSGAPRAGVSTYALLEQRAPRARPVMPRPEAIAELAWRYARSRGPVTAADFGWWAGVTLTEARRGLADAGSRLVSEAVAGETRWRANESTDGSRRVTPAAHLLPWYDEYLVSYKDRSAVLDPQFVRRVNAGGGLLAPCILLNGQVAGTWRRTLAKRSVDISLTPFEAQTPRAQRMIEAAAARYGRFLGLDPALHWT